MIYIGIDPGLSGAVAIISGDQIGSYSIPTLQAKGHREYIPSEMVRILRPYGWIAGDVLAALEQVHSMPKEGVRSSFTFGRGMGLWEGILSALAIPYILVPPARWQNRVLGGRWDPEARRLFALRLWGDTLSAELRRKADGGKADALLIARYLQLEQSIIMKKEKGEE